MIRSFRIEGYRGFRAFELNDLGRVNLLVGRNNGGKTSLLEALELFGSRARREVLWSILERRGEVVVVRRPEVSPEVAGSVAHLFHGHAISSESRIRLSAAPGTAMTIEALVEERDGDRRAVLGVEPGGRRLPINPDWTLVNMPAPLPVRAPDAPELPPDPVFVGVESVDPMAFRAMFDAIVLTEEEAFLYEVLRTIAPDLERMAAVSNDFAWQIGQWARVRAGVVVKLRDIEQRVPMGSLGGGFRRLASLALSLVRARGGMLLVDEIDTGLHHTVMDEMWRMVRATAERLNVQVFATTHSRDCVESLAVVCSDSPAHEVTIHRIEPEAGRSVAFSEQQIRLISERGIEVR